MIDLEKQNKTLFPVVKKCPQETCRRVNCRAAKQIFSMTFNSDVMILLAVKLFIFLITVVLHIIDF